MIKQEEVQGSHEKVTYVEVKRKKNYGKNISSSITKGWKRWWDEAAEGSIADVIHVVFGTIYKIINTALQAHNMRVEAKRERKENEEN